MERIKYFPDESLFKADAVSKGLGISRSALIEVLNERGFDLTLNHGGVFSGVHIRALAEAFVEAVHTQYDRYLLKRRNLGESKAGDSSFFRKFMRDEVMLIDGDDCYFLLDDEKIEHTFYRLIGRSIAPERKNAVISLYRCILRRMVSRVKSYVSMAGNGIHAIVPPKLFFTYTDEEDSYGVAFTKMGFAMAGNS
jgi:hypothetical protein